jgi:anti-anti-sigma factor
VPDITAEAAPLVRIVMDYDDSGTIVRVTGDVDLSTVDVLATAIDQAIWSDDRPVFLDLSSVSYMDATAVQVLARCRSTHGPRVSVRATSRSVDRIFQILNMGTCLRSDGRGV